MAEQTESSIVIAAPRASVMAVIADVADYPSWNDEIKDVEVLASGPDGRPARARFVVDAGAIRDTYVLDYRWVGDDRAEWNLVEAAMLTMMDGSYTLAPAGKGTEVTYRLTVDVRIPMIGMMKRKAEKVLIDRALKGLKERVER